MSGEFGRDRYSFGFAHNRLPEIQGGTTDEYYHLTLAQHTAALAVPATYVPYSGAIGTVDLGTHNFYARGFLAFGANATASATQLMLLDHTFTSSNTTRYGALWQVGLEPGAALTGTTTNIGLDVQAEWNGAVNGATHAYIHGVKGEGVNLSTTNDVNEIVGIYGKANNLRQTNVGTAVAGMFLVSNDDALGTELGNITDAISVMSKAYTDKTTGTITNRYGFYFEDTAGAGNLTNQYAIYCPALTAGATDNYFIKNVSAPSNFGSGSITTVGTLDAGAITGTSINGLDLDDQTGFFNIKSSDTVGWFQCVGTMALNASPADGFYIYGGDTIARNLFVSGADRTLDQDVSNGGNVVFGTVKATRLQLGNDTTYLAFYSDEGDIYSDDGKAYFGGGINAVTERYGVGLQVREKALTRTLTYNIDATFTAATATILKVGQTFVTNGVVVGDFLIVTSANDTSYVGSCGVIIAVTETAIIVSLAAAGAATPDDLTAVDFVVYNHPVVAFLDNGDIHFNIGVNADASFRVRAEDSNNDHAAHFNVTAGINGNRGVDIEYDPHTYGGTSALHINYDATAFAADDTIGTGVDIIIDNTGATAGDVHALDVIVSNPLNTDLEVEALATHEGVDVIAQYLGDPAVLEHGYSYESAAYTDRTVAFNAPGTDVEIFAANGDFILVAAKDPWDEINIALNIPASHTIVPVFEYIEDDGSWVVFVPNDGSNGFSQDGAVSFDADNLTTWGTRTVFEVTGAGDNVFNKHWIKITRARVVLPTPPTEDTIQITTLGAKFGWDKEGDAYPRTIAVRDGITAPDTVTGRAIIYVDTADGDLKVKFGNGFVATLAADS